MDQQSQVHISCIFTENPFVDLYILEFLKKFIGVLRISEIILNNYYFLFFLVTILKKCTS